MTESKTDIPALFAAQAALVPQRRTSFDLAARRDALQRLKSAIQSHEDEIVTALFEDFGKHPVEVRLTEILPVYQEIGDAIRNLRRWMRVRRVPSGATMIGASASIRPTPKGTALIIAPWNFPFMLAIGPLVSALAAGCSAIIKPSEMTPATSALIATIVSDAFDPDLVTVVQGGPDVANALLAEPFDHIFFTGSPEVGKIVMAAAAKTLASVTLELGGKSPVVIGPDADIAKTAKWIAWGRFINAGQTCVAPDHVFVHESQHDALVAALRARIAKMYGDDPAQSSALARVINGRHHDRITALITDAQQKGAQLATDGMGHAGKIAPTILLNTDLTMDISHQEIFGPVLPIIKYSDLGEVIARINGAPHPLALYAFGGAETSERVINETTSGSVGVNVTILTVTHPHLPFGGVGNSGVGAGHGHAGFKAFSHMRPILRNRFLALPLLFPPYTKRVEKLTSFLTGFVRR
ncbi:aldehyde dehydrogenase family protein [Loktanella sp. S4079]|uniref:aldehyde dehydrogenase family protein n=1 Tax=Loktanella sp. S4079 TaxID=579483 RepID=UPI0005F9C647|nr:aldehyde dehydrogenase family protein [Loktanella sp. S4079]KJZ20487.1 aldehyde dehydrogenase [Loktanella sp. S4079]